MDQFYKRKTWTRKLVATHDVAPWLIDSLWDDPNALVDSGDPLVNKNRVRTIVRLEDSDQSIVIKRYVERSFRHLLKQMVQQSRAARCWNDTLFLLESKFPTPMPIAYREERFGPFRGPSFYVYQFQSGQTLLEHCRGLENQRLLRDYVSQLVNIWQLQRRLCVSLHDANPGNFLVDAGGKIWVIDLDKLRREKHQSRLEQRLRKSMQFLLQGVFGDQSVVRFGIRKFEEMMSRSVSGDDRRKAA